MLFSSASASSYISGNSRIRWSRHLPAAEKVSVLLFGRERRAGSPMLQLWVSLRKVQQIQGALAPGLLFVSHNARFQHPPGAIFPRMNMLK